MKYIFISTKNKKVVFISKVLMNESKMKLVEEIVQQERGDELVKKVQQMQAAMEKVEYESSEKVDFFTSQFHFK